jgi:hypothetical protein
VNFSKSSSSSGITLPDEGHLNNLNVIKEREMGWVTGQIMHRAGHREEQNPPETPAENSLELRAEQRWAHLAAGFKHDVEEFNRHKGNAVFQQISDSKCRISNPAASTAVIVTADLDAQTIEYQYEPEDDNTAVPEDGILTLRKSDRSINIYSADQKLNFEQARRLILEPVLFPGPTSDLQVA